MSSSGIAVSITAGLYQRYQQKAILPVPLGLAELLVPWLFSAVEERFGSHVPTCAEVISPTSAARSDWKQCALKCSSYGWVRSSIRCPDKKEIVDALLPQFHNFISVIREFAIKSRLCGVSASCRCNGGGHTHIQGRTACKRR